MSSTGDAPGYVVVAGVAGTGKTTLGRDLAERLRVPFVEGDDLHRARDVEQMRRGHPLDEQARGAWLDRVAERARELRSAVVTCSALARSHRDRLRDSLPGARFLVLETARSVLERRVSTRDHFFAASLLDDQLERFEAPEDEPDTVLLDTDRPKDTLVDAALRELEELGGLGTLRPCERRGSES